jgi:alpha-L-arabinofuranosidase
MSQETNRQLRLCEAFDVTEGQAVGVPVFRVMQTLFFFTCLCLPIFQASAQAHSNTIGGKPISPDLFGLFFEDINYAADGGLYAELVQNRSFEYNPAERREWHSLSFWDYINPGFSYGQISVETRSPVHVNNPHYLVLNIEHVGKEEKHTGPSGVGVKNAGFDGIVVNANDKYNFSVFAQQLGNAPVNLAVSLQTPGGKILAEEKLTISGQGWKKFTTTLTPDQSSDSASLVILAITAGKIALDVVSLFPEKTFRNRPNGLRPDLAQVLADMKPRFIRFPGGCLVHGDGLGNMYRWKNTIGPIEQRVEQRNLWGYHQTVGLGYFEYFQFCEDIGAKPLPVLPAAVSCQNSGGTWRIGGTGQRALPMEEMDDYIQEVLDLIEWANGPASSAWGSKRAAAGHPEPFQLKYIGIGNEDKITPEFESRFKMIYDAVKAKHPEIEVIGTVGPFPDGEDFTRGWAYSNTLGLPVVDEHYYKEPKWLIANQYRYDSYDRSKAHVYLGEYASWGNTMFNAIAEALYMIGLERNGDVVRMASYAPLFARKDHIQWKTDMIFFDNRRVCLTPNYYVQQLFSINAGDTYFDNVFSFAAGDSTLAASCVRDKASRDIILKIVNGGEVERKVMTNLSQFTRLSAAAVRTVLSGDKTAENTLDNQMNVAPVASTIRINKRFDYTAPPMSLTIVRIKQK